MKHVHLKLPSFFSMQLKGSGYHSLVMSYRDKTVFCKHWHTGTFLHEWVEEGGIDEEEEVSNELWGNFLMELTVRQESPSVRKNVHYTLYLSEDLQSTPSQG